MTPPDPRVLAASIRDRPPPPQHVEPVLKPFTDEPWDKADAYSVVDARSGGRCECNGIDKPGCGRRAEIHHHIAGRVGTDPHRPSNLLHLADECHRRIHANPRQSYKDGTMRSRLAVEP